MFEQRQQRGDETADRARLAAWERVVGREYYALMNSAVPESFTREPSEAGHVLGDYGALFCLRGREDRRITRSPQVQPLGNRINVVAAPAKLNGDRRRPHRVEE